MDITGQTYSFTVQREVIEVTPALFEEPYAFEFWMDDRGFKAQQKMKGYFYRGDEEPEFTGVEFRKLGDRDSEVQEASYGDFIVFTHWGKAEVMTAEQFAAAKAVPVVE